MCFKRYLSLTKVCVRSQSTKKKENKTTTSTHKYERNTEINLIRIELTL